MMEGRWLLFVLGFGLYTCARWMYRLSIEPVVVEHVVRTAMAGGGAEEPAERSGAEERETSVSDVMGLWDRSSGAAGLPEGSPYALSRAAMQALPFTTREVKDQARYTALPRNGTGVMCIAGHVNSADPGYSVYLEQCMYALGRWHAAFQLAGGKYLQYKLTLVTDRQRFERQKQLDAAFRTFAEHVLTIPVFFDDWVGTPNVALGKMKMPQSTKFQGFPQLWVHKFEAFARSPFQTTLFIDYDVHACAGAERVFDDYAGYDLAPMDCKFSCWGGTRQRRDFGAYTAKMPKATLTAYTQINEPLTAGVYLNTDSAHVRYVSLLARDIYIDAMRIPGNPIKHDQPALREAMFLAGHRVNHTRIDEFEGCDFKIARACDGGEGRCKFLHGKITVPPVIAGGTVMSSWAGRIGV